MSAFIRCICHLNPDELSEDDFIKEYNRAKYVAERVYQVKFI